MEANSSKQQLLQKFLADQCSRAELEQLLTYLQHDQEPEYEAVMQQAWDKLQQYPKMSEEAANRIFGNVMQKAKDQQATAPTGKVRPFPSRWYQIAAVMTGLLFVAALVYKFSFGDSSVYQRTAYGQTMTITLPDQSVVKLNGNSSVRYKKNWDGTGTREVWLDGEAFFSVTHTKNHQPFMVHATNEASVEVLGTKFTVSDRKQGTRVVLNSGRIRLHIGQPHEQKQLVMQPGDMVELQKNQERVVQKKVNPRVYSAWTEKHLIFDNTPLREVADILRNTYGLKVHIADSTLLSRQVSGSTPTGDIDIFLKGLSRSFNLQITRSGDEVDIRSNAAE